MSRVFLLLSLLASVPGLSQDDKSWWKSLFSKEVRDKNDVDETPPQGEPSKTPITTDTTSYVASDNSLDSFQGGSIHWELPDKLSALNDSLKRHPRPIKGFRVAVFSGSLEDARKFRTEFLKENPDMPCFVRQNAPNFEVRLGNYRTYEEAYPTKELMKSAFPFSHVVRDDIDIPDMPSRTD